MKTSELTGAALDWAVAKCDGYERKIRFNAYKEWEDLVRTQVRDDDYTIYSPSTDWAQGGPIIERERISIIRLEDDSATDDNGDYCGRISVYGAVLGEYFDEDQLRSSYGEAWGEIVYIDYELVTKGQTPLIAAMRCYVASKLGDNVELPDGLA